MRSVIKYAAYASAFLLFIFVAANIYMGRNTYEITNLVINPPPYPAPKKSIDNLFMADLHVDTFNFKTNFFMRNTTGHVDLPRIQEAGFSLMTFAIATEIPFAVVTGNKDKGIKRGGNLATLGAVSELEPVSNWLSQYSRGLYSIDYGKQLIANSEGQLKLISNKADLNALLDLHQNQAIKTVGVVLSVEGSHIMEGELDRLDTLHEQGVRMMSLTHAFDNEAGGSSEGVEQYGITPYGEKVIQRMNELGMIVDIAHSSPELVNDILDRVNGPVVYSHGGIQGTCDRQRNLRDAPLQRIKANGGLIALGFWPKVTCGEGMESVVKAMRYVKEQIGIEHIALGSDFDGGVKTFVDATGTPMLVELLLKDGFSENDVRQIMGLNYLNLLRNNLPE